MSSEVATVDDRRKLLRKLTPKQRLVLRELPKNNFQFWRTLKALGLGTATGHRWMRDPEFAAARIAVEEHAADEAGITRVRVLSEVAAVAYADPRKLFDAAGNLKPIHELDDQTAAAVAAIEFEEIKLGSGEDARPIGRLAKIKTRDKLKALEMAGKFLRLWNEEAPKPTAPEGPGLTVVVNAGGAQTAVQAQQGTRGHVVVDLPGPE